MAARGLLSHRGKRRKVDDSLNGRGRSWYGNYSGPWEMCDSYRLAIGEQHVCEHACRCPAGCDSLGCDYYNTDYRQPATALLNTDPDF